MRAVTSLLAIAAITASSLAALQGPDATAAEVVNDDYCVGQCHDILPPGNNGNATLTEILAHQLPGTRPRHAADQLEPYDRLASGYGGLTNAQLGTFFNDASFGVPANQVESTIKPAPT